VSPTTKKILIALAVLFVLSVVGCIVFGVLGASMLQQWGSGVMEQGQQADADARAFAAGHDQEACIVDALRRDDLCGGTSFACEITAGVFLQRCLENATPVAGLCDDVPPAREIIRSAQWTTQTCEARGHAHSQECTRLLPAIQRYCDASTGRGP
jgi:hypothetical protein